MLVELLEAGDFDSVSLFLSVNGPKTQVTRGKTETLALHCLKEKKGMARLLKEE